MRLDRFARRMIASEAERAVDATLAGPLPEAVARSIVRNHVLDRFMAELGSDVEWEKQFDELVERAVANPMFRNALEEVMASDALRGAVRSAVAHQTSSFGDEIVAATRTRLAAADERVSRASTSSAFGGLASRIVAFVIDAAIIQLAFALATASIGLALSLFLSVQRGAVFSSLGTILWVLFVATYFIGFWSVTGQTLGLRFTGEYVLRSDGTLLSVPRAALRLVALVISIAVLFLGLATIPFDRRRRGVQDFVADTVVLRGNQLPG